MEKRELDALFIFSNESEPVNVRYLADYWSSFETTAILIPSDGEPLLIIGPESMTYAKARSKISKIRRILEFIEATSEFELQPNMIFSADTWLSNENMGIGFEDGIRIKEDGAEHLSNFEMELSLRKA